MDEQSKGFRSAWFGGFKREDVMQYIEQTDSKYYAETEELRRQLTEAQSALGELREQNETLTEKNAELLERLGTHRRGAGCVWVRKLPDIDETVLEELIAHAWQGGPGTVC